MFIPPQAPPVFYILIKPTGAICNLACTYCFYLSKELLYPGSRFKMTDELLELFLKQLLHGHCDPEITISWQGGEPTLMGVDFYERAVKIIDKLKRPDQKIIYTIQTNGTLLTEAWCRFLKQNGFLVGLSLDGPRDLHDAYRLDKSGKGTYHKVLRGLELIKKYGIDFNILCSVHAANQDHPLTVYRFLRDDLEVQFIQFIPIVERIRTIASMDSSAGRSEPGSGDRPLHAAGDERLAPYSVNAEVYGRFLMAVFDEWIRRDVGNIFVQHFDSALANWLGVPASVCVFQETCGQVLALEHNGDLYSCDHFVEPAHQLGNIAESDLNDLVVSDQQIKFGLHKKDTLPACCRECSVLFACHGECPKNRFINTPNGENGLNYLCAGYKAFFTHIDRTMRVMAGLLRNGRPANEIMQMSNEEQALYLVPS